MTARTLPVTPSGGLSLVHQPTSRHSVTNPLTQAPSATTVLGRRIVAWLRRANGPDLAWEQERLIRDSNRFADSYAWTLRTTR